MTTLNLDNFSKDARNVLERAQNLARKRHHRQIEPLHALISLVLLDAGPVPTALRDTGANVDTMLARLQDEMALLKRALGRRHGNLEVSLALVQDIDHARALSRDFGASSVEPQHLLLAIAEAQRGLAGRILRQHGATPAALRQQLGGSGRSGSGGSSSNGRVSRKGPGRSAGIPTSGPLKTELIEQYGRDITAMAENDELDPVVGREEEIRRMMQVLTRRSKNNPVLIGEPGVGKSAVVEALCMRLTEGDVPKGLSGVRVFSLEMGSLVAGTSLRGQFEERLKGIVDEVKASNGRIIVYIDEIHTMVGTGGDGGSSNNAANLLKPALARGEIRCIGTTTQEEYKEYIEEDKALVRRFQKIHVDEPDVDQTVAILRGIKQAYEIHHRVRITDAALVAAAKLGERYLTDRNLPDKAIDLIDEAAARLRLEIDSKPTEVDILERRIENLEIERAALVDESAPEAVEARERLTGEIAAASDRMERLSRHWMEEKEILDRIAELKETLQTTEQNIERASREGDKFRVAELTHSVKAKLLAQIDDESARLSSIQGDVRLLKQDVEPEDIGIVVSDITGIPVTKMMEGEREKLLRMDDRLSRRVVGQDEAIDAISAAVQRSRAGVSDPNKPIGNFFFVGPTGVGKTELAKALAEFLFDSESNLIRIDMSEYQEQAKVNTLIGSARGYVGSEKGGVLTEQVRHNPYSVVLFDEAEKAHPKVFDLLLSVMDEGRLTDSQGLEVDFTNTIVIMTSNVGSRQILEMTGKMSNEEMEEKIRELLKDHFRPEFLNRIDDIVVFNALDLRAIRLIVDIQLKSLNKILAEQKLHITLTEDAKAWIAQAGYEPEYGARPLKRAILTFIQDPLATEILEGNFVSGDTIAVDVDEEGEELLFSKAEPVE